MSIELENSLKNLPIPSIIEVDAFDKFLAENIVTAKEVLGEDWLPLESDPYMKQLRILTLRAMHNQADKNETIKQLLITTATGINLDHLGIEKNVLRDKGEKPRTTAQMTLSTLLPFDVTVFAGTVVNNAQDSYSEEIVEAVVVEDVTIAKGDRTCIVELELDKYVRESDVQCENIVTTLPFVARVKQLQNFTGGFELEDDDRYRYRIILSNAKYSTAGCSDAYEYFTRLADSRIDDVTISAHEGVVKIVVHSFTSADEAMLERVYEAVSAKSVRPISDAPVVKLAEKIDVTLDVNVELFNPLEANVTEQQIRANFENAFFIGQDLVRSDVDRKCHLDNVYRVNTDFIDVLANDEQVINIVALNLSFSGVSQ